LASFGKAWKDTSLLYLESFIPNGTQQCDTAILNVCVVSLAFNQTWKTHEKREFSQGFEQTYSNLLPSLGVTIAPAIKKAWQRIDSAWLYQASYKNSPLPEL